MYYFDCIENLFRILTFILHSLLYNFYFIYCVNVPLDEKKNYLQGTKSFLRDKSFSSDSNMIKSDWLKCSANIIIREGSSLYICTFVRSVLQRNDFELNASGTGSLHHQYHHKVHCDL